MTEGFQTNQLYLNADKMFVIKCHNYQRKVDAPSLLTVDSKIIFLGIYLNEHLNFKGFTFGANRVYKGTIKIICNDSISNGEKAL